jgi:hypothetical protein
VIHEGVGERADGLDDDVAHLYGYDGDDGNDDDDGDDGDEGDDEEAMMMIVITVK